MVRTDKLAILMATYNGSSFIKEQIESLLSQTYQDWVLFIHDDDSNDGTKEIIQKYSDDNPEKIIVIDGTSTGGAKNNFFYLLENVDAPVYMFCDQDDVWLEKKIQITVSAYKKKQKSEVPALVFTDLKVVDSKLNTICDSLWKFYNLKTSNIKMQALILQNVMTGCTMLINKKLRDMMISYHNIDNVPMHDKWAAMIALQFGLVIRINRATILYRQHENNSVGAKEESRIDYMKRKMSSLSQIRKSYEFTRRQAIEFCECFNVSKSEMISIYASTAKKNKICRIVTYLKNDFRTNRKLQSISLLLLG